MGGAVSTICVWELRNCGIASYPYAGMMYADCNGTVCSCAFPNCTNSTTPPPVIMPTSPYTVTDQYLTANIRGRRDTILTTFSAAILPFADRPKELRSNGHVIPEYTIPAPFRMIPAAEGDIMKGWGQGSWVVKYLKCLRLTGTTPNNQYFALYKIYNDVPESQGGSVDLESDLYIGMRVASAPSTTPGGLHVIAYSSAANIQELDPNNDGIRRELGVRVPIPQNGPGGTPGNPLKWFHLFGSSL